MKLEDLSGEIGRSSKQYDDDDDHDDDVDKWSGKSVKFPHSS